MRLPTRLLAIFALTLLLQPALSASITLDVSVNAGPTPSVTMVWNGQGGRTVHIWRRPLGLSGINTWTEISANASSPYVDSTVVNGEAYEYSVRSLSGTTANNALAHFVATINTPLNDSRGAVLIVVEDTWTTELEEELKLLELNLAGDGWVVERMLWNREGQNNGADLKAAIQTAVANNPDINSLFIFGAVEMVKSGYLAPDGHAAHSHETDLFYGDLDGLWTDTNNSSNYVAGDGEYDQSDYPSTIELRTGRVTFHDMPAFKKTEVEYLRDYIHKEHAYRLRHRDVTYQNFVGDDFYLYATNMTLKPMVGTGNWNNAGNLDQIIGDESYLVAVGARTSSWDAARDGFQKAIFTACFRSHIQEWWSKNNNMRGMLTQPDWGLTALWGGRPAWYLHKLAAGAPIGQSVIDTQNDLKNSRSTRDYEYYSDEYPYPKVSTNLMGDPTIRVSHVEPVGNLNITRLNANNIRLSWTPSPATDLIGYHVYSSSERLGPYERLTATPISATTYDAPAATGSDTWFQVRAVADVTVRTGVYEDQSHARFALAYADGSVNTPPSATDFTVTGKVNTPTYFAFPATDADGDPLTPIMVDNPDNGQIRWWEGQPYYVSKRDQTGTDTATYVLFDGVTVSEPATITFIASDLGETLAAWELPDGSSAAQAPSYTHPKISSTTISGGPGTSMISSWPGTDALTSRSIGSSLDPAADYFQWTLTPESGARMNLSRINLGICGSSGDNIFYQLRVSADNFATYSIVPMLRGSAIGQGYSGNSGVLDTADASGVQVLQNQSQPVQFRLHFWHTGSSSTSLGIGKITDPVYYDAIEDVAILGSITDANGLPLIQLSASELVVSEEGSASVNISLSAPPASPIQITVERVSGDSDLSITSGATLNFDSTNWEHPQSLVFNAGYDADPENGSAQFSISGGELATVFLNVTEEDTAKAPVTTPDSYEVTPATLLTVSAPGVLGNDADANNEPFTAVLVRDAKHGDLTLNSDGSFTYLPGPDFEGLDTFTYLADDGVLQSAPTQVILGVPTSTIDVSLFGAIHPYTLEDFDAGQVGNATPKILGSRQLTITGNGWFCLDLTSVTISADTWLSVDFSSAIKGEIHGVGFALDKSVSPESTVQFSGSQAWADANLDDYDAVRPATKHYNIPIGQYFTGTFRYLVFAHDDDANIGSQAQYANIRLYTPTTHTTWADAMGLDPFGDYEPAADANSDGKPNAYHFGLAGNPLSDNHAQSERMSAAAKADVGSDYMTLTVPIRLGATFNGSPLTSAPIDGVIYKIYGDSDLLAPLGDLAVQEVIPALSTGLPSLPDLDETPGADWEYRTFRIATPMAADEPGFLWIDVSAAP